MEGQPTLEQRDAFTWFTQSQLQSVVRNGVVPEWFHGIISRKTSEDLLMSKPPGYFLIRVSQTRTGYTLSYRAAEQCRHFMIDVQADGQYIIVGEDRCHQCLQDLVDFHRRQPIMPFNEVLTIACGQSCKDQMDYAELLFTKRGHSPNTSSQQNRSLQPSHRGPPENLPPALPQRPNALNNSTLPPNTQTHRLYPNLEAAFQSVISQLPTMLVPKTNTAPGVPARSCGPPRHNQPPCMGTVSAAMGTMAGETPHGANVLPTKTQEVKHSVMSNLKNLKKKFQKTRPSQENTSEMTTEHLYHEISMLHGEEDEEDNAAYSYINTDVTERVPPEYRPPPPFAPGY